jgi:hypothetical protein
LRDEEHVRGKQDLDEMQAKQVQLANSFIDFSLDSAWKAHRANSLAIIETPRRSWLKKFEQYTRLLREHDWQEVNYAACCWFAARAKQQSMLANFREASIIATEDCHHVHSSDEWTSRRVEGKWHYPSKEEAEYTAELAFQTAIALSMGAAATGKFKLQIPEPLTPCATGSRQHWTSLEAASMRSERMCIVARQLRMVPPKPSSIPRWCPAADAMGQLTVCVSQSQVKAVGSSSSLSDYLRRVHMQGVAKMTPKHVYCGRGSPGRNLQASIWANRFTIKALGRKAAVQAFRAELRQNS